MRVACPQCGTLYEVSGRAKPRLGRRIRCAVCSAGWTFHHVARPNVEPASTPAAPAACARPVIPIIVAPTRVEAPVRAAVRTPRLRRSAAPRSPAAPMRSWRWKGEVWRPSGAVASIGCVIAGMALIGLREKLVRFAPPTARLYAAVGAPVNVRGVELQGVTSKILEDGPERVLAVEGRMVNLRQDTRSLAPLRVAVRGEDGREIYAWLSPAPKATLAAGESALFRARLVAPPKSGRDVQVRFAEK